MRVPWPKVQFLRGFRRIRALAGGQFGQRESLFFSLTEDLAGNRRVPEIFLEKNRHCFFS